ncbi:MAG: conjugal transfer protein TraL [Paraburkholderia sp.]|uniref:conjugal transfer protein TraL n=1 Tax=Paraburkholderia sp. TaxID=1926495 RepID=UPI001210D73B|nr:conjugal transfer protein TraL [Paraburkholderia sp.]TAM01713.1 MAG: conjugal transfer protein TraL [Paraburkholderia sp.]
MLNNSVHFVLQGKGGVGKSLVASLVAQYFLGKQAGSVISVDTDPVNATFSKYESLKVAHVDIADGTRINERKFDEIIERMASHEGVFVVDNGAATFLPLTSYMSENSVFEVLAGTGKAVYVHSIITAGQGLEDTVNGFNQLATRVDDHAKIVLWLNEFWGKVEVDGHPFTATKVFKAASPKVAGVVKIEQRNPDTFGADVRAMTEKHQTFNDIQVGSDFGMMAKQRLKRVMGDVFTELDQVKWGD